jgi:hypothetical protein
MLHAAKGSFPVHCLQLNGTTDGVMHQGVGLATLYQLTARAHLWL